MFVRHPLKFRQLLATNSCWRPSLWYPYHIMYWDHCVYWLFSCTISWSFIFLKIFCMEEVLSNLLIIRVPSFITLLCPSVGFFTEGIILCKPLQVHWVSTFYFNFISLVWWFLIVQVLFNTMACKSALTNSSSRKYWKPPCFHLHQVNIMSWLSCFGVYNRTSSLSLTKTSVQYCREIFHSSDGGTFALDWLRSSDGRHTH